MTATVTPDSFVLVDFRAGEIAAITDELAARVGLAGLPIEVCVDESTPLARVRVLGYSPVVVEAEGGAFEDPRRLRHFCDWMCRASMARVLLRVADRRHDTFASAPADGELTMAQAAAWDTYAWGRAERLGCSVQPARRRYAFRNRHGFTDVADASFDALWGAESLSWDDVARLSAAARAVA